MSLSGKKVRYFDNYTRRYESGEIYDDGMALNPGNVWVKVDREGYFGLSILRRDQLIFDELEEAVEPKVGCTCGAEAVDSSRHARYCDKQDLQDLS